MKRIILISAILFLLFPLFSGNAHANIGLPIWFNGNDASYTLEGHADMFLVDEQWRICGYKNGQIYEDIPEASIFVTAHGYWADSDREMIVVSPKKDMKLVVVWKKYESYKLTIVWGNYFLTLANIETSPRQIDEIISKEDSLILHFDNRKQWVYSLEMNNYDYSNGSVRYPALLSLGGIHKYLFDWNGISVQKPNSVVYTQENSANTEDLAKKYEIVFSEDSIEQYLYLMENPIIKVLILFASFGILILYMRRKKRKNGS